MGGGGKRQKKPVTLRVVLLCVCAVCCGCLSLVPPLATSSWVPALSKPRSLEYGSELRGSLRLLAALSTAKEQSCEFARNYLEWV